MCLLALGGCCSQDSLSAVCPRGLLRLARETFSGAARQALTGELSPQHQADYRLPQAHIQYLWGCHKSLRSSGYLLTCEQGRIPSVTRTEGL